MFITLVQFAPVWEDKPASITRVRTLLAESPPRPGGLIVLPEMFATGFSLDVSKTRDSLPGADTAFCAQLARETGCCVVGGCVDSAENGAARNIAAVFSPNGEVARYVKQRPFTGAGEHEAHVAGKGSSVFQWQGRTVAPLVCYDLRFPELFRAALGLGAEVFTVIAAWPARRIEHWVTLLRARAIENQAWVIGVNRTGAEPRFIYSGRSIVVNPHGEIVADLGEAEAARTVEIDAALAAEWRSEFPAVRDYLSAPPGMK